MRDDQGMPEQWIVRVQGKDYGPADLETLREWKREGRVLSTNQARPADVNPAAAATLAEAVRWTTAAEIPGLFEANRPPVQVEAAKLEEESASEHPASSLPAVAGIQHRSLAKILFQTLAIYRRGFFQFLSLTFLIVLPSMLSQLTANWIETAPNVNLDLRNLVVGGFGVCMTALTMALWPVYIAGIQILSAEIAAGRRVGFLTALNEAVRFWPRVALLCVFVYGVFFLLIVFGLVIAVIAAAGGPSLLAVVLALGLLVLQVWMFGRFFINVLFWQQFAVLEDAGAIDSYRASKELARSGDYLPWFQRPKWRGAIIASLWFAFVLVVTIGPEWTMLQQHFNELMTTQDPQALLQKLSAAQQTHAFDLSSFALGLAQRIFQPLLGIAFVVLYLDARQDRAGDD
jgi:hypothetical protein